MQYNARLSADSIVPGAGPLTLSPHDATAVNAWASGGGGPANPQDLNRYSYTLNNPVNATDPTGHFAWIVAGAVAGAAVAYGAQVYNNYQSGMDIGQAMTTDINVAAVITGAVAGAVIGGSLGVATAAVHAGAIPGYTVGSALSMGAIGSASNMVGNAIGQYASSGSVNLTDLAVAGVTGFAAGMAAPIVGSGLVGSAALNAVANTGQYVATQSIKGEQLNGTDIVLNAASGAVAGAIGGATTRLTRVGDVFDLIGNRAGSIIHNRGGFLRANVTRIGLARGLGGAMVSNWSYR